jgi:hypothetical protein
MDIMPLMKLIPVCIVTIPVVLVLEDPWKNVLLVVEVSSTSITNVSLNVHLDGMPTKKPTLVNHVTKPVTLVMVQPQNNV